MDEPFYYISQQDPAAPILQVGGTILSAGNGQLAAMMGQAAHRLGYKFISYGSDAKGCAREVSHRSFVAAFNDKRKLRDFARSGDIATIDWEGVPAEALETMMEANPDLRCYPSPGALRVCQNRSREITTAAQCGISTPWSATINGADDIESISDEIRQFEKGLSFRLKSNEGGYDGKYQARIKPTHSTRWVSKDQILRAWENELEGKPCVIQEEIKFDYEISITVARGMDGSIQVYPPFRNTHHNGILSMTEWIDWDGLPLSVREGMRSGAIKLAQHMNIVGLLTVEYFVKGELYWFNEMAPRLHNSGHITLDAGVTPHAEQHIRAITGLPLGRPDRRMAGTMYNIIGDPEGFRMWVTMDNARIWNYGKDAREGRKLGHVNVLKPIWAAKVGVKPPNQPVLRLMKPPVPVKKHGVTSLSGKK